MPNTTEPPHFRPDFISTRGATISHEQPEFIWGKVQSNVPLGGLRLVSTRNQPHCPLAGWLRLPGNGRLSAFSLCQHWEFYTRGSLISTSFDVRIKKNNLTFEKKEGEKSFWTMSDVQEVLNECLLLLAFSSLVHLSFIFFRLNSQVCCLWTTHTHVPPHGILYAQ